MKREVLDPKAYQQDLKNLLDSMRQFGQAHPELAHQLQLSSLNDFDPTVERLIEALAFMNLELKTHIDNKAQETVRHQLALWHESLGLAYPSCVMVQAELPSARSGAQLKAHEVIQFAGPNSDFKFSNSHDFECRPLRLLAQSADSSNGALCLTLQFELLAANQDLSTVLSDLPLYIHERRPEALRFYHEILSTKLILELWAENGSCLQVTEALTLSPSGFGHLQSPLPNRSRCFRPFDIWLDYFCFSERLNQVQLPKFDPCQLPTGTRFTLKMRFINQATEMLSVSPFKINCLSLINIYNHDFEPMPVWPYQDVYPLTQQEDSALYGALQVQGSTTTQIFDYQPKSEAPAGLCYELGLEHLSDRLQLRITLSGHELTTKHTLSVRGLFHDGQRPRALLRAHQISHKLVGSHAWQFTSLDRPSAYQAAPTGPALAHLASLFKAHFLAPHDLNEILKIVAGLNLSNCPIKRDILRKIDSVQQTPWYPTKHGISFQGLDFKLVFKAELAHLTAELYLFAQTLFHFLQATQALQQKFSLSVGVDEQEPLFRADNLS